MYLNSKWGEESMALIQRQKSEAKTFLKGKDFDIVIALAGNPNVGK